MKKTFLVSALSLMIFSSMQAQEFIMPQPSPISKTEQQFSTSFINVEYSRPSMKGRAIFGSLVPFDKLWRTGANSTTKVTFGEDVQVEGVSLPAGKYSLYTIPGKENWTVVFSKQLENWGATGYTDEQDALRVRVTQVEIPTLIETFTISVDDMTNTSAVLGLMWEKTYVPIRITTDNKQRILDYLKAELNGPKPPYYQAASYYLEQGYQLSDALIFVNKAIAESKDAFWMHWLKAKIYAKMGDTKNALDAAGTAAKMAKGSAYEEEYMNNFELMKSQLK